MNFVETAMGIVWILWIKTVENRDNFRCHVLPETLRAVDIVDLVDNLCAKKNPDTRVHTPVPGNVVD